MTRRTAFRLMVLALAMLPLTGCSYNTFVSQEEAIKAQWAQVQNQLQRRNDLIPNLVETVKGYAAHEEGVYKDIADARSRLLAAKSPDETIQAANQQTGALGRLMAVVENYPQLRANEQFNRLMDELSGTENRIAVERMRGRLEYFGDEFGRPLVHGARWSRPTSAPSAASCTRVRTAC